MKARRRYRIRFAPNSTVSRTHTVNANRSEVHAARSARRMPIRDCRETWRPDGKRKKSRPGGTSLRKFGCSAALARSRIAMAQQVGGAVALDAPASSVSYRRTTPYLKERAFFF